MQKKKKKRKAEQDLHSKPKPKQTLSPSVHSSTEKEMKGFMNDKTDSTVREEHAAILIDGVRGKEGNVPVAEMNGKYVGNDILTDSITGNDEFNREDPGTIIAVVSRGQLVSHLCSALGSKDPQSTELESDTKERKELAIADEPDKACALSVCEEIVIGCLTSAELYISLSSLMDDIIAQCWKEIDKRERLRKRRKRVTAKDVGWSAARVYDVDCVPDLGTVKDLSGSWWSVFVCSICGRRGDLPFEGRIQPIPRLSHTTSTLFLHEGCLWLVNGEHRSIDSLHTLDSVYLFV